MKKKKDTIDNWSWFQPVSIGIQLNKFVNEDEELYNPDLLFFLDEEREKVIIFNTDVVNDCPRCAVREVAALGDMLFSVGWHDFIPMYDEEGNEVTELSFSSIMEEDEDDESEYDLLNLPANTPIIKH